MEINYYGQYEIETVVSLGASSLMCEPYNHVGRIAVMRSP